MVASGGMRSSSTLVWDRARGARMKRLRSMSTRSTLATSGTTMLARQMKKACSKAPPGVNQESCGRPSGVSKLLTKITKRDWLIT